MWCAGDLGHNRSLKIVFIQDKENCEIDNAVMPSTNEVKEAKQKVQK